MALFAGKKFRLNESGWRDVKALAQCFDLTAVRCASLVGPSDRAGLTLEVRQAALSPFNDTLFT
jgi:hypothetical protein